MISWKRREGGCTESFSILTGLMCVWTPDLKKMNQIITRATFHLVARCLIFFFIHVSDVYTIDKKKKAWFSGMQLNHDIMVPRQFWSMVFKEQEKPKCDIMEYEIPWKLSSKQPYLCHRRLFLHLQDSWEVFSFCRTANHHLMDWVT